MQQFNFPFPFWVISDTHWGHDNIIRFCNRPDNHDELMRDAWIDLVKDEDIIIHLGDLSLKPRKNYHWIDNLPGRKYLLRGNHDKEMASFYQRIGFTLIEDPFSLLYKEWVVTFTHEPDREYKHVFDGNFINIHGHIHNNEVIDDERFINVSVELTDYKPVWITDILDNKITELAPD